MASPSTPVHPARYLAFFLALLVGVYLLVFLTGDKQAKPKLGIDLQGGTRVTLTARTPDGSAPTRRKNSSRVDRDCGRKCGSNCGAPVTRIAAGS